MARSPSGVPEEPVPFTLTVLSLAVVISLLRGGRLRRVADAPLRGSWLLALGLGIQLVVDISAMRGAGSGGPVLALVALLSGQLAVLVWVVRNWQLPGMTLIAVGLGLNTAVIAANGAMPVDPSAIDALGLEGTPVPVGRHTLLTEATRLAWLADVVPIPWLRSIVSAGDLVLAAGLLPLTHALMTYRTAAERRTLLLAELRREEQGADIDEADRATSETPEEDTLFDPPAGG